jgi:hypothetical protein
MTLMRPGAISDGKKVIVPEWLTIRHCEILLNNYSTFSYHLDISMDALRKGVKAPLIEEVFINHLHDSFLLGLNHETHPKGVVSFAAPRVRDCRLYKSRSSLRGNRGLGQQ